ncbi:MAG: O-methyltransferase [Bacteroidales bacterium]|nr:O-methyltransferase [Bacteroidales bacterium]
MEEFELPEDPRAEAYLAAHTTPPDPLLARLDRETHVRMLSPRMLSGAYQGRFLEMVSRMLRPKRILEVGAFTGYGTLCLAAGLAEDGEVLTIEHDPLTEELLRKYIAESPYAHRIHVLWGEAEAHLARLAGEGDAFDLIFLDADKARYADYYPMLKALLRPGGWLLADNILWNGKVWDESYRDKDTQALRRFNDLVQADPDVENLPLRMRDGLMIIRKIN